MTASSITTNVRADDPAQAAERALRTLGVRACAVDLETTGPEPTIDRIISIGLIHVTPGGGDEPDLSWRWSTLVCPEMGITPGATEAHGLTDGDVVLAPTWDIVAGTVAEALDGAVWVGHGVRRFDADLLAREYARVGIPAPRPAAIIDTLGLITRFEPRTLTAAVAHYLGRIPTQAHDALGDAVDAAEVLGAMLTRYPALADLVVSTPPTVDPGARGVVLAGALAALSDRDPSSDDLVEPSGRFVWRGPDAYATFGKVAGKRAQDIDAGFYRWLLGKDFPDEVKAIAAQALKGRYPTRDAAGTRPASPSPTPAATPSDTPLLDAWNN